MWLSEDIKRSCKGSSCDLVGKGAGLVIEFRVRILPAKVIGGGGRRSI